MNASPNSLAMKLVACAMPAVLIAGCATGPTYQKPEVAFPQQFRAQLAPAEASSFADLPWWSAFEDPALRELITKAVDSNYDLQIAVARIEQARALVGVVESEGKPQLGYQAGAGVQQSVVQGVKSADTATFGGFGAALNASWELDLWGRIRHATDSARANLLAQEDVRRGVMLTLVSDLATGYFRLIELDRELAIATESADTYKRTVDLFSARFNAGRDSRLPVERAQASYDAANAQIADLTRAIAQQENALSVLAGGYPGDIRRGRALDEAVAPATPIGTTTAVLQRRPDILQAEQRMIGANAEIGVAAANFFPRIGLSALLGAQDVAISSNWSGFGVWNLALSAAGPIFSGGRLESAYKQRQAFWDETVAEYKKTVLIAFQETSDALIAQQTLTRRRTSLESQVGASRRSVELAEMRYQGGRATYFEVLEAQQQLFPAEDALAQTKRDQLIATVSLYKALGGGWTPETKTASR